jgi:hypothetical protein
VEEDRVRQLEAEMLHLMEEVDRYRTATDDTLEQINWCIGYLAATGKGRIARALSPNRDYIRSNLLHRAPHSVPTTDAAPAPESA